MSEMQIQNVLAQMRQLTQSSGVEGTNPAQQPGKVGGAEFQNVLRDSLRGVNDVQQSATDLQTRFELGDENVSLPQVMVAMNKSSIAFEATNQVRNRLLNAYQEIMRMQV
ncbi:MULTISPECIES: flagellar hook-basal body complex protein FliE [unclassified Thioalkalivibrio]|uniref:flagellar hook-basal body complex protein FliE n=1 Tax=unclassified Thioalkalivibrio TaxID=2621013 RepID=UPI000195A69C|nr:MULTISPECIES: flagellar hook-basal body complex protein FliE [unclassified Thioalkalivibrio]ADC71666.1 flagellar hook-basal body complex subunit FliE [Thioalkalivibrio sp. K90mix]